MCFQSLIKILLHAVTLLNYITKLLI
jgi:hypothetical protein